ncbi:hypothetical protein K431DRAFT_224480 [Polychaeton citri CBS 116435]|uniref:VIT-domain-containing protein n=1 Tax=Polychaeton citri CBS 116435 TaxID=1314669 RepID=A0A9P4Q8F1_9PEZI|nr:hypothetical protein K431DRAFT_224480 [Polychaeton citri CBS 116435]
MSQGWVSSARLSRHRQQTKMSDHVCGCYYNLNHQRCYLPQVTLDSHTTITAVHFQTKLLQTFHNPSSQQLSEIRYAFPLYDGIAVTGYTVRYGNKVLQGVVKQKDDAKKTYKAAVDCGRTAGLLESLPAGIFGITLGNIPAKSDIFVDVSYAGELKHDAAIDGLRYTLPTSIAPRYGSYPGTLLKPDNAVKTSMSIVVDVDMGKNAIRKITAVSHRLEVAMGGNDADGTFEPAKASAGVELERPELIDDFVLQIVIDDISRPCAVVETHPIIPNQRAVMATFVPKFAIKDDTFHPEIVFVADQSGSMSGSKNDALIKAMRIFLKSLPLGVRFNVIAFGNDWKSLWDKSQAYNEQNLDAALEWVSKFNAGYGGTEILKPVKQVFKQRMKDLSLEVMVLTDGEVWGEDEVFDFINAQIHEKALDARIFTLGIGGDVSHTLVEGIARAGNGFAQFTTAAENIDQKVIRMLKAALYPHTANYSLEVNYSQDEASSEEDEYELIEKVNDCLHVEAGPSEDDAAPPAPAPAVSFFDDSMDLDKPEEDPKDRYSHLPQLGVPKVLQAPAIIPPLFPFNRCTLYLLLGPDSPQRPVQSVTLRARAVKQDLILIIPTASSVPTADEAATIHQLAARKATQNLEQGCGWLNAAKDKNGVKIKQRHASRFDELVEREAVRLGETFQTANKWCSFVAVEENADESIQVHEDLPQVQGVLQQGRVAPQAHTTRGAARMSRVLGSFRGRRGRNRYIEPSSSTSGQQSHQVPIAGLESADQSQYSHRYPLVASVEADLEAEDDEINCGTSLFDTNPMSEVQQPPAPASKLDNMRLLIDLQKFDGSWVWNQVLASVYDFAPDDLDSDELGGAVLAPTVLAIAFLEHSLRDQKDVWEFVVEKAKQFLCVKFDAKGLNVRVVVERAKDHLNQV